MKRMWFKVFSVWVILAMLMPLAITQPTKAQEAAVSHPEQVSPVSPERETSQSAKTAATSEVDASEAQQPPPPESRQPVLGTSSQEALTRIDPALRETARAGGDEQVLVWVMAVPDVDVSLYGQVLAATTDKVFGWQRVYMRVPARNLLKIAGLEGVSAIVSVGPKPEPAPPDPEAPGARAHGMALSPEDLKIDPQRLDTLRQLRANAQPVTAPPQAESPAAPEHWFENDVQGVSDTWAMDITGRGDPANPVKYAVIDTGVDFCNAALVGRWAVENAGTPYDGWPIAYDDRSAADFVANYPAPGSGYGGNWGWYVNASHVVTGTTFVDILYSKTYTVPVGISQSGTVYYGYHPDTIWHTLAPYGASPVILVSDPNVAGQYDTVYVDGDWDGVFDLAMEQGNPVGCVDWTGPGGGPDGVPDDSYGLLYWISDGVNPLPGVDWLYGTGTPVPPAGRVVMLMLNNVFEPGGDHGTLCASSAAGAEPPHTFQDPNGILPSWYASPQIIGGPASGGPNGPWSGAEIIPIGNTYAGGNTFNEYLFTVFGYDGMAASGDDANIASMSFGSGSEDADAWDFQSEYLAALNLYLENFGVPSPIYVDSAGNGGHGYGTVNTPAPATGVSVGASTQYGPYNVWGTYEGVSTPGQSNFMDVQPWSDRGPTAMSTLAPHVVANGAWGSGALPVNLATYINGFDGSAAWDLWGGTSRSGPVAAGMLGLIYDAYWQGSGNYPDWRLARELLMNGALDIGYDEKVAGSGQAYALRSTLVASGTYGIYVDPPFYQAGSFPLGSGQQYESFAVGMLPGTTDVTTFTVNNPSPNPITVNIRDEQLLETDRYTLTLTTNEQGYTGTNYLLGAPDYLVDLTPMVLANPAADLMIVRVAYPFSHFDEEPPTPPGYDNRWIGLVYNVFDDGDGVWWNDLDLDGRVDISPTVSGPQHELDLDDEYIRFTYSYLRGTMQEMRVRHPADRMGDAVYLGLAHYVNDGSDTDLNIEVIFYREQDWDQVFVDPPVLTVPPGAPGAPGQAVFTATVNSFVRSTPALTTSFETWPPAGWTTYATGATDDPGWLQGTTGTSDSHGNPHSGTYYAWHNDDDTNGDAISWLVSPQFTVPADGILSFWQRDYYQSYYQYHGVWITTDANPDPSVSTYVELWSGDTGDAWTRQTIDLSAYAGQDVYLAFRYEGDWMDEWYIDDVLVYALTLDPPGEYMGRIIIEDPGNGTYDPHDIVVPVEKQVWFDLTADPVIGGGPPAPTPYDNGRVYGAFSWGGRSESGDWRVYPFVVEDAPPGSVILVDNVWEDYPTDIDTLLLDRVPPWDFWTAGGPPGPYPLEWFGPYTMDYLGSGSERVGTRPNWIYHTNAGTNHEFVSAPAYDGLHVMLHHAVLYGGEQTSVPFTTTIGLATISPNPVILDPGLTCVSQTFTMTFKSGIDLDGGLVLGGSFGWYTPTVLTSQVVHQDDPNDPTTASWVYPIHLEGSYRLDVETFHASGPDLDLFVVADNDSSGTWTTGDTVVGASTSPTADESVSISGLPDGDYLIAVHGWNIAPDPGTFDIRILNIIGQGAMSAVGLPASVTAGQEYSFTVHVEQSPPPGKWRGLLLFGPALSPTAIEVPVLVNTGSASKTAWQETVLPGDLVTYTIALTATPGVTLPWSLVDVIPSGMEFVTVTGAVYSPTLNAILWSGALGSGTPLTETFESAFPPPGWTVWDNAGTGNTWDRNDAFGAPNRAAYGSGFSAAADADYGWNGQAWDTELWSPPVLLTTTTPLTLTYASNFQDYAENGEIWLDISADGGMTWDNLRYQSGDDPSGGTFEQEDLSAYAGQMVLLRWRYAASGGTAWYWHIDNVSVPSQPYNYPTHVITLTLRATGTGIITNTAQVHAGNTTCSVADSVNVAGAIPEWDKDILINGTAYGPGDSPYTVVPGDEVSIVDRVKVTSDDPITYTLTEAFTGALGLDAYQADFGTITSGSGVITWSVTGGISGTWYTLTKTFTVDDSAWAGNITETLTVDGGPAPIVIPLAFNIPATLNKDGPSQAFTGEVVTYTLVVETAEEMYPLFHNGLLTDTLPAGVTFAGGLTTTYGTAWYDSGDNAVYWTNGTNGTALMAETLAPATGMTGVGDSPDGDLTTFAPAAGTVSAPHVPSRPSAVLWDQPLSAVNQNTYANQDFEAAYDGYDIFIADDFTNAAPWAVDTFFVPNSSWNPGTGYTCTNTLNWQIYADDGGLPAGDPWSGGAVWGVSLVPTDTHVISGTGVNGYQTNITMTLDSPLVLPPGTWWLAFYPQMDFSSCGQTGRNVADTTNGYDAVVINPAGGFGLPTTWTPITDPATWGMDQQDMAFRLEGETTTAPPTVVTITFQVTVTAAGGSVVTNTADLNYDGTSLSSATALTVLGYGVEIAPPTAAITGTTGSVVTYTLTVTNTGNVTDTFDLTASGNAWTSVVTPSSVGPLAPGASGTAYVAVSIPAGASDGDTDTVTITAASQGDNTKTDTAVLTTTALQAMRYIYLPLIMK